METTQKSKLHRKRTRPPNRNESPRARLSNPKSCAGLSTSVHPHTCARWPPAGSRKRSPGTTALIADHSSHRERNTLQHQKVHFPDQSTLPCRSKSNIADHLHQQCAFGSTFYLLSCPIASFGWEKANRDTTRDFNYFLYRIQTPSDYGLCFWR